MRQLVILLLLFTLVIPAAAQDAPQTPLETLLSYVPDTPEYRRWIAYGNQTAWLEANDVPRPPNVDALDSFLFSLSRESYLFVMPTQTNLPGLFSRMNVMAEDYRGAYGFDMFVADAYLEAGLPPEAFTLVTVEVEEDAIDTALTTTGYDQEIRGDGVLYSILEDFETDIGGETVTTSLGRLGALNRVYYQEPLLIIGPATELIDNALTANTDEVLLDAPEYAAALAVLNRDLADYAPVIGAIMISPETLGEGEWLPFSLAVFSTHRFDDRDYLMLTLIVESGEVIDPVMLRERMNAYEGLRGSTSEVWRAVDLFSVERDETTAVSVIMQLTETEANPLTWYEMLVLYNIEFLLE